MNPQKQILAVALATVLLAMALCAATNDPPLPKTPTEATNALPAKLLSASVTSLTNGPGGLPFAYFTNQTQLVRMETNGELWVCGRVIGTVRGTNWQAALDTPEVLSSHEQGFALGVAYGSAVVQRNQDAGRLGPKFVYDAARKLWQDDQKGQRP